MLHVDRHHEPAGLGVRAGAQVGEAGVGVAQHVGDPVALRVERRAQAAGGLGGGQPDGEVGVAAAAVGHPLHVAVVGVERHGAADAVQQRVGVAVGVVGGRDAVLVVGDPRDRRVVGAERGAGQQQSKARALERRLRAAPPRGLVAHVVRLVGQQQRRDLFAAAAMHLRPRSERLVGDRDAVAVARLGAGGVRAVGLDVEPVAGGVGGPLAGDVGGRRHDADPPDPALGEHPVRDVEPERRLARRRGGGGEERTSGMGEHGRDGLLLPAAQGAAGGPRGERADRHQRRRKLAAASVGTSRRRL